MNLSDPEILELHDLLDGLVESNLSIREKERLQELLESSAEARAFYVRFLDMSASIKYYADELVGGDSEDGEEERGAQNRIVSFFSALLPLAAVVAVGFYFFLTLPDLQEGGTEVGPEKLLSAELEDRGAVSSNGLAVLTKAVGVEWSKDTGFRPELGSTLEASRLKIEKGLAQVEFLKGATVILEGPVDFEITNPNGGSLFLGKLRASVPEVAIGFAVDLPKGKLIDLGTEFGLNAHSGGSTEIFVYRGEVLYQGLTDGAEQVVRNISGGEALFVDPYGFANWVEMPSEAFIGTADLAFRSREESQLRHQAWLELRDEIAQSADTLLYYTFDNHSPWSRILKNQSNQQLDSFHGAIIGCSWSDGRWPGKGALTFKRKNDRVRMGFHEKLSSVTLSSWIKIDKLTNDLQPILCSESSGMGAASWFVDAKGRLVLEVHGGKRKDSYQSAVAFRKERLGRWMHLATTFDQESKKVSHFINGRSFSHEKIRTNTLISFADSLLGHLSAKKFKPQEISLQGSVDEFVILSKSISEGQIRKMYELGCPYEKSSVIGPNLP